MGQRVENISSKIRKVMKTLSKAAPMHKKCLSLRISVFFLQYSGQKQNLHVPASTRHTSHSSHQHFLSLRRKPGANIEEIFIWKNLCLKGFLSLDAEKHANDRNRWLSAGKKNGSEIKMGTWGN